MINQMIHNVESVKINKYFFINKTQTHSLNIAIKCGTEEIIISLFSKEKLKIKRGK